MMIDLDEGRFTQKQVLEIVPDLTAKTLQNWTSRHIIPAGDQKPGRQGKRLYTSLGVIMLAFMSRLTRIGVGASAAAEMAQQIARHAESVHSLHPHREENGVPCFAILADAIEVYHRGYIYRYDDELKITIQNEDLGILRTVFPEVYITIEVDQFILTMLNRIYDFVHGVKRPREVVEPDTPETRYIFDRIKRTRAP